MLKSVNRNKRYCKSRSGWEGEGGAVVWIVV